MSRTKAKPWPDLKWWRVPAAWAIGWTLFWLASSTFLVSLNLGNFGAVRVGRGYLSLAWPVDEGEVWSIQGTGPKDGGTVTVHRTWPWFGRRWYGTDRHPGGAEGELVDGWELPHPPGLGVWPGYSRDSFYPFVLWIPCWMLAIVSVIPVAMHLRRSGRYRRGLCPRCKYDRRGSFAGPCSECGTVVLAPVTRSGT